MRCRRRLSALLAGDGKHLRASDPSGIASGAGAGCGPLLSIPSWPFLSFPPPVAAGTPTTLWVRPPVYTGAKSGPWAGGCDGWGGPRGGDASVKRARVACAGCGAGSRHAAVGGCLCRQREKPLPGVFRLFSGCAAALAAASAFPGQIKVSEGTGKRG